MAKRIIQGNSEVAVAYVRVSTDEQSLGPEAQRTAIERWPNLTSAEAKKRLGKYLEQEKGTEDAQEQARKGKGAGRANRRPSRS